jgi:phospholipid transport system transporter-binding protein
MAGWRQRGCNDRVSLHIAEVVLLCLTATTWQLIVAITEVDSSAVSLLLEWKREALRRKGQLLFANIPQKLQTLLMLYGISEFIKGNVATGADHARARDTVAL